MIDQAYQSGNLDSSMESIKDENWDVSSSKKIFALELGPIGNAVAYFASTVFMEEFVAFSIIGFHFLLFKNNLNTTIAYVSCFVLNAMMTLISKKAIGRKRPDVKYIERTSKSTWFRIKQNNFASCPSGDTIQSTTLVVFAALCLPSWAFWCVLPIGFMTPLSRIYLGCHWITDTLWGALFSGVLTFTTVATLRKFADLGI